MTFVTEMNKPYFVESRDGSKICPLNDLDCMRVYLKKKKLMEGK